MNKKKYKDLGSQLTGEAIYKCQKGVQDRKVRSGYMPYDTSYEVMHVSKIVVTKRLNMLNLRDDIIVGDKSNPYFPSKEAADLLDKNIRMIHKDVDLSKHKVFADMSLFLGALYQLIEKNGGKSLLEDHSGENVSPAFINSLIMQQDEKGLIDMMFKIDNTMWRVVRMVKAEFMKVGENLMPYEKG